MAKLIYGVSGEGSGHSSRASEIIPFLLDLEHKVKVVSYDRGYNNLKDDFDAFETEGLHIASTDNKVSVIKTFTDNLMRLPEGHRALQRLKTLFKEFKPDCVITDFEPMTAYLANHYNLPLVTLDNQHRIRYMDFDSPLYLLKDKFITKAIIRSMIPKPDVSLVTTFYFSEVKNKRTFLFPPIIRKQVIDMKTGEGNHILVYVTSGFESLVETLKGFRRERFILYGYDKSREEGNVIYKPFSKEGFLKDLSQSRAVIATAGFTLLTESIYMKKPFLAVPMRGQFEQELNGLMLEAAGYGVNIRNISREAIGSFFYRIPEYKENLMAVSPWNNSLIKDKLKGLLENNCALAKNYHIERT